MSTNLRCAVCGATEENKDANKKTPTAKDGTPYPDGFDNCGMSDVLSGWTLTIPIPTSASAMAMSCSKELMSYEPPEGTRPIRRESRSAGIPGPGISTQDRVPYRLNPTQMFNLLAKFAKSLLPANEAAETEPGDGNK